LIFVFGDCELDLDRFELRRDGRPRPVEPQVFDLLAVLIRERHRVVPKEELLDIVWGNRFVSESALTSRVKAARQAIGDDGRSQRLIRTARGRGYQFVVPVDEAAQSPSSIDVNVASTQYERRQARGEQFFAGHGGGTVPVRRARSVRIIYGLVPNDQVSRSVVGRLPGGEDGARSRRPDPAETPAPMSLRG
jgi:DNA-binding winged helix-turn-helix (wHTH) protein